MSTSSHRDVWPEVAEWFLDQSDRPGLADVFGEGVERALGVDVETDVTVGDVDEIDIAASYDLEDVEGIGPTYADRVRSAGIESDPALAVSEERTLRK
jgi:polyhydroxyalkanoate synthase